MTMYDGSRYTNVYTYDEDYKGKEVIAFYPRQLLKIDTTNAFKHTWIQGQRLDILADRYYGDPQYWWFILDANSRYMEESEIQNGDILLIPPYSELRRVTVDNEN